MAQGVQRSDLYDQLLYEEIMKRIAECEQSVGCDVLDLNESMDIMHLAMREENIYEHDAYEPSHESNKAKVLFDKAHDSHISSSIAVEVGDASKVWDNNHDADEDAAAWGGMASLDTSAAWKSNNNLDFSSF